MREQWMENAGKLAIVLGIALLVVMLLIIVWLLRERRLYRRELNHVLSHLDQAIAGVEQEVHYDESMDAAITEKMNQLVVISKLNAKDASHDRDLVQALISDIAHQVRTPLTNIMLYAGILKEQVQSADNQKMAEQIQRQSEKLEFFMKELVRSSYLETKMISVHIVETSIDELIAQSVQSVELAALKKKILFQLPECEAKGQFDLRWTKEALVNVLDNAIKYSPEESTITVNVVFYENFFCIQITDEGIGIEEQEQGAIFGRFYRSPRVEKEPGLGIGLYLVREIIEKQNGYVKVRSALGEGTTFFLYLPICQNCHI